MNRHVSTTPACSGRPARSNSYNREEAEAAWNIEFEVDSDSYQIRGDSSETD